MWGVWGREMRGNWSIKRLHSFLKIIQSGPRLPTRLSISFPKTQHHPRQKHRTLLSSHCQPILAHKALLFPRKGILFPHYQLTLSQGAWNKFPSQPPNVSVGLEKDNAESFPAKGRCYLQQPSQTNFSVCWNDFLLAQGKHQTNCHQGPLNQFMDGLQSMGSQRVRHNQATNTFTFRFHTAHKQVL